MEKNKESYDSAKVKKMFLQWSADLASCARKFVRFCCIMEKKKPKDFKEDIFWNRHKIWGFYQFWNNKKNAASNTKHNNLNALCGILNNLCLVPKFKENFNDIRQSY